ncbi:MAG: lipoyl synthase [Spirochaetales bacterium]|nr:lipoyl synthase [Spirochaetales bacterium]
MNSSVKHLKKPEWLRIKMQGGENLNHVKKTLDKFGLTTVCHEASCPNRMECFNKKTATFMILGSVCTRGCTFCDIATGAGQNIDKLEPKHIADAVKALDLEYVVVTSVTRDDLPDGGAFHFADVIKEIKKVSSKVAIEVLIPDFKGNRDALNTVINAGPVIINHNIETVPGLYKNVRPQAKYNQSLELLRRVKETTDTIYTKSGMMVGLGETQEEVLQSLRDLRDAKCDFLTIGQYLAPSKEHHSVIEYVHPDVFEMYKKAAMEMGFKDAACGPLVRSSYKAHEMLEA